MPVGFENSALKMSFSLSSLQSGGGGQGSPQQVRLQAERPYNSLTKKTKETCERESWRRSWDTQEEKKDEFWAALKTNYNYLMDNNLIESCREANGELVLKDFTAQFCELCSWLDDIREAIYGKEENIRDRNLRLEHVEGMQRNAYKRELFKEQAGRLLAEHSELQDEVTWRLHHLNSKWDMLEQFISPSKVDSSQISFCADVEHEADCLKEWIREMEHRLKPIDKQSVNNWSNQELVEKITEYEVLHQDIRAHGKVVAAVLKRAELAEATASVQLARRLERRWQLLYLRALERQVDLETLLKARKHPHQEHVCSESDEEPLSKQPRLSSADCSDHTTDEGSYFEDDIKDLWFEDQNPNISDQTDSSQMRRNPCSAGVRRRDAAVYFSKSGTLRKQKKNNSSKATKEISSDIHPDRLFDAMNVESSVSNTCGLIKDSSNTSIKPCAKMSSVQSNLELNQMDFSESVCGMCESIQSKVSDVKIMEDSSDEEWTYTCGRRTNISKQKEVSYGSKSFIQNPRRNVATRLDFGEKTVQRFQNEDESAAYDTESDQALNSFSNESFSFPSSLENNKECIQLLVQQAELLVREDSLACSDLLPPNESKQARIKQWVKMHSPVGDKHQLPDSCDASGEYTTGDSEEECTSEFLEDSSGMTLVNKHLDALMDSRTHFVTPVMPKDSNATLRRENSKDSVNRECSKVVTTRQKGKRDRPWSVSGISQITAACNKEEASYLANFSTSESALHQMAESPSTIKSGDYSPVSPSLLQENLSSSTVYENSCTGSLPRRKGKPRKKHSQNNSKVEASSESVLQPSSSENFLPSPKHKNGSQTILKTPITESIEVDESRVLMENKVRTVSETTCTSVVSEVNSVSDSSIFPTDSNSSKVESDLETPGEPVLPVFRLGPKIGAITTLPGKSKLDPQHLPSGVDSSDVERTGILQLPDEQLSSSEQAWDNYQVQLWESLLPSWRRNSGQSEPVEKYMSEPYSEEIADTEEARRLLEFGDDYHNYLDSLSDGASSLEVCQKVSPTRKRKSVGAVGDSSVLDSDSDLEDIHHLIKQSHSHLSFTQQVLSKHVSKFSSEIWLVDYEEIVATCKENKHCLRVILENVKKGDILTLKERKEIEELLTGWDSLQIHSDELQCVSSLQQKLMSLRKKLLDMTSRIDSLLVNLNDLAGLDSVIEILKEEMQSLLDFKDQLAHLNVAVHELVNEPLHHEQTISSIMPQLKDDVTDLHNIWSKSFESVSTRLSQLEKAVETWHKFDREMSDLQTTLQGDDSTLLLLRQSLDDGASSIEDVAVSIRDIARALSGVPVNLSMDISSQEDQLESCGPREGSLSDSGISDAGSEHELYVRARRLASLQQLAQDLQSELGTSEGVVTQINERISYLDNELHRLQEVCRKLIVRTRFWMENPHSETTPNMPDQEVKNAEPEAMAVDECDKMVASDTVEASPWVGLTSLDKNSHSIKSRKSKRRKEGQWIWRFLRTAVPVQIALFSLFYLACVFEPHCCENVNNLGFSLTPQLRYVYGPPPI